MTVAAAPAPRVILAGALDGARRAHLALVRRAFERHGAQVTLIGTFARPGFLERFRGGTPLARVQRALADGRPELLVVFGDREVDEALGDLPPAEPWVTRVRWLTGAAGPAAARARLAAGYDRLYVTTGAALDDPAAPAELLPWAADPSVHRPLRSRDQYRANVVFAGTATPAREELLAGLAAFGLALWGPGWRRTGLRDYCRGELIDHDEYVRASAGASVAVNIHDAAPGDAADAAGLNRRAFELAAIGVPQVADRQGDLARHFDPGQELYTFGSAAELREVVELALGDGRTADLAATIARRRVLAQHTYMHRVQTLLALHRPAPPSLSSTAASLHAS